MLLPTRFNTRSSLTSFLGADLESLRVSAILVVMVVAFLSCMRSKNLFWRQVQSGTVSFTVVRLVFNLHSSCILPDKRSRWQVLLKQLFACVRLRQDLIDKRYSFFQEVCFSADFT
jgi:hypothetical protein